MESSQRAGAPRDRILLSACVAGSIRAGEIIRAAAGTVSTLDWREKMEQADFVTEVDEGAERALAQAILALVPDGIIAGEELHPEIPAADHAPVFVADPLDGTTNFLHGYPWYAVSIGAMVAGELRAAAVLNVPTGEMYTATLDGGARRNGQPITVSGVTEPRRALLGTGLPFKHPELIAPYLVALPPLLTSTSGIRRAGSAALDLCDVACGRFDAFWELMLAPWDIAAGILLVREAGGIVTDLDGKAATVSHTGIVAGNATMHGWLLEQLGPSGAG